MLDKNKTSRISIFEALNHRWFNNIHNEHNQPLSMIYSEDVQKNFENYKRFNKFLKAIKIFTSKIKYTDSNIKILEQSFIKYDIDHTGYIKLDDFVKCLKEIYNINDIIIDDLSFVMNLEREG